MKEDEGQPVTNDKKNKGPQHHMRAIKYNSSNWWKKMKFNNSNRSNEGQQISLTSYESIKVNNNNRWNRMKTNNIIQYEDQRVANNIKAVFEGQQ
jgi:hypothetical protein